MAARSATTATTTIPTPAVRSSCKSPSRLVTRAVATKRNPLQTRSALPQLSSLLLHLASERGLSENTIHAYRRDLENLDDYFRALGRSPLKGSADDYRAYLREQTRSGQ